MRGAGNEEWAVDILRYLPAIGPNALDLHVAEADAPRPRPRREALRSWPDAQSGAGQRELGPAWRRVTPLLFRFGDHIANFDALRGFKARFNPHFEPRYLACTAGFALPHILQDITALIERGGEAKGANRRAWVFQIRQADPGCGSGGSQDPPPMSLDIRRPRAEYR